MPTRGSRYDTHMQVQNMPQLQPQPQLAQQVLAGRELARSCGMFWTCMCVS